MSIIKKILNKYRLTQAELATHMGVSSASVNLIINHSRYPKNQEERLVKSQIADFLRSKGVSEKELEGMWALDRKPTAHGNENPNPNIRLETEMLAQETKKHFKLFKNPFGDIQESADIFNTNETRYIRESMYQVAVNGGFLAVVGESGAGKSTLRRDLIDRCLREKEHIVFCQPRTVDKSRLTAAAICDSLVMDASTATPFAKHEQKARQVEKILTNSLQAGNKHCLLIEEAHDLNLHTLKYLKRIYELEAGFKKLVSIILIGQTELKDKLDERMNWDAREVIRRCEIAELQPLNNEVENYLKLKFQRIGVELLSVFEADAFTAIQQKLSIRTREKQVIGMSYPLVVNNFVIKCMNQCTELGLEKVNAELVRGI